MVIIEALPKMSALCRLNNSIDISNNPSIVAYTRGCVYCKCPSQADMLYCAFPPILFSPFLFWVDYDLCFKGAAS